jgi:hypothetical protein
MFLTLRRGLSFLVIPFLFMSVFPGFAQEEGGGDTERPPIESDWGAARFDLYAAGDKTFTIAIGVSLPMLFLNNRGESYATSYPVGNINIGGTGSLSFNYFLSSHLFLGGELQFMFAGTLGGNMLYLVPMGARVGWQFIAGRFEFPLSFMAGIAPQSHGGNAGYFGLILKPQGAAFWRFNSEWSFGLNAGWWFIPQWPKAGPEYNRYGNFVELTLAARYHF